MKWNWQRQDWPKFCYQQDDLRKIEEMFLYNSGLSFGAYEHLSDQEKDRLKIDLISSEALKTSEIEGEILNRESLQSSIRRNFGLKTDNRRVSPAEKGIADMMVDLYENFAEKLTHKTLFKWHKMLTNGRQDLQDVGRYRNGNDPMQIVSGRLDKPKIHFEAPTSILVNKEMTAFINWFNNSAVNGNNYLPALARAAVAHLYFVSIHPFEDGNGRISRALAIKSLSQSIDRPLLTSLSTIIENQKKEYYKALEDSNKSNEITRWIKYFAKTVIKSQLYSKRLIEFLIYKAKFYQLFNDKLNDRQLKVINRMFEKGIDGFEGGLSAKNYVAITKTSKATATRDLKDLIDNGSLIKIGELKASRYYFNFDL